MKATNLALKPLGLQFLRRNMLSSLLGAVIPGIAWLVAVPVLVHRVGIEPFGIYTMAVSIAGILGVFEVGVTSGMTKYIAQLDIRSDIESLELVISTSIWMCLMISLAILSATYLGTPIIASLAFRDASMGSNDLHRVVHLAGWLMAVQVIRGGISGIPRGFQRYDVYNLLQSASGVVLLTVQVVIAVVGFGVFGLLWANLLVSIASLGAFVVVAKRCFVPHVRLLRRPDRTLLRLLISFTLFMLVVKIFGAMLNNLDKLVVGRLLGTEMVTYYAVPVQLSSRVYTTGATIVALLVAVASEAESAGELQGLRQTYIRVNRFLVAFMAITAVLLALFSEEFLTLWMGKHFAAQSAHVLSIASLAFLFQGLTLVPSYMLIGLGHVRQVATMQGIMALATLSGVWAGSSRFGPIGAALGMALGVLTGLSFPWYLQRRLKVSWKAAWQDGFGWSFSYAVVSILVGAVFSSHFLARVTVFFIFLGLFLFLGNIRLVDWQEASQMIRWAYKRVVIRRPHAS